MPDPTIVDALKQDAKKASRHIAAILVYERGESNAANWMTGGTCTLVSSPDARFLLTADHVMREIEALQNDRKVVVFLGGTGNPVDITDWTCIDRNALVDLHTIEVPKQFDASIIQKQFFIINEWPLQRANVGDSAFVIGYPAAHRQGAPSSVGLRITPIADFVTDVGPRKFTMADETDEREVILDPQNLGIPNHFGGMSGSPAFRGVEGGGADLIGVFSGGGDGLRGAYFLSHSDFVLSDGRFDQLTIPPM